MPGPIVRGEEVRKAFGGKVRALEGAGPSFESGIICGLLGPNGAGKTTLIRRLTTRLEPDSGSAGVAGIDAGRDRVRARRQIGLAGRSPTVDDLLTGRQDVEVIGPLCGLPAVEDRRRAAVAPEGINLTEAADRPARTCSGGMRRRPTRPPPRRAPGALPRRPTTGIDPRSRLDAWDLLRDVVQGDTTVWLTTQYLEEADTLADRIAVLDRGRLLSEGTADEMKDRIGGAVIEVTVEETPAMRRCGPRPASTAPRRTTPPGASPWPPPKGSRTLLEAVGLLTSAGIAPEDVALPKPTLDDVFRALTGQAASETTVAAPDGPGRRGRRSR